MIHFYILLFLGVVTWGSAILISVLRMRNVMLLRIGLGTMFVLGVLTVLVAFDGARKHKGYTHFDPAVCAQMVYDQDEKSWVCITWEEAG